MASNFSSIVSVARPPTPWRSGTEPFGEPNFEENTCVGEFGANLRALHHQTGARWPRKRVGNNKTGL